MSIFRDETAAGLQPYLPAGLELTVTLILLLLLLQPYLPALCLRRIVEFSPEGTHGGWIPGSVVSRDTWY
jgi:hypothetical protein